MQLRAKVAERQVRVTTVAVEKQTVVHILSVCICSFDYSACSANAL
jgi:hypothetical protein